MYIYVDDVMYIFMKCTLLILQLYYDTMHNERGTLILQLYYDTMHNERGTLILQLYYHVMHNERGTTPRKFIFTI